MSAGLLARQLELSPDAAAALGGIRARQGVADHDIAMGDWRGVSKEATRGLPGPFPGPSRTVPGAFPACRKASRTARKLPRPPQGTLFCCIWGGGPTVWPVLVQFWPFWAVWEAIGRAGKLPGRPGSPAGAHSGLRGRKESDRVGLAPHGLGAGPNCASPLQQGIGWDAGLPRGPSARLPSERRAHACCTPSERPSKVRARPSNLDAASCPTNARQGVAE
jgi:hypothetical protein